MAVLGFDAALAAAHKFDPAEARDQDGKWTGGGGDAVGFHGASAKILASVTRRGLKPGGDKRVWLANNQNTAALFGSFKGKAAIVFEVHVPKAEFGHFQTLDAISGTQTGSLDHAIPPDWIKGYRQVLPGSGKFKLGPLVALKASDPDHVVIHVMVPADAVEKDYNPSELRDDIGRWTAGGGMVGAPPGPGDLGPNLLEASDEDVAWERARAGVFGTPYHEERGPLAGAAFVSPNVQDKTFGEAAQALHGGRQQTFERAAHDIDQQLGLHGTHSTVLGAWSDGAENSTMTEIKGGADQETLRLSAAMKGALAQQKAVLTFATSEDGQASLYDMEVPGDATKAHADLLKAGIAFHTLSPNGNGTATRVIVVDTDGSLHKNVGDFAEAHGTAALHWRGNAEFIGDDKGTGSDAEQRARAQDAYAKVIASATSRHQGRTAGELWQSLHNRWAAPLEAIKRALGFHDALAIITKAARPNLYVHRPLLNASRLHAWAARQGIKNLVPPEEMHVTQVYSRTPVDLTPLDNKLIVKRRIAPLGPKGAVVLHFDSPELQARHQEAMAAGASHDWPSYVSHVTLSYDAGGADLDGIGVPDFPLEFGPEVHAALNDDWAKDKGLRKEFDPSEPRDDRGRWAGLGDSPGIKALGHEAARGQKAVWIRNSPLKTITSVYARAAENKRMLDKAGAEIAAITGMEYRSPGIKKPPRVLQKDDLEKMAAGRSAAGVTDIVRATFVADTPMHADRAVTELAHRFPITDEGYKETEVGYFDRAVNVRFPNGQIGEVLIAPPELINAKSDKIGGGHGLYKQWRALPAGHPDAPKLAQAQKDVYGAAKAKLSPQWKEVLGSSGIPEQRA